MSQGKRPRLPILAEAVLSEDGMPLCAVPDDCAVCVLFDDQRPGESRREWLDRIVTRSLLVGAYGRDLVW